MKKYLLILQLCLFCVIVSNAQKLIVNAPSRVSAGENFRLTYTVSTQNVSDFRLGSVPEALEVITGPYTSSQSSFQMINGHTSSTSSVTYTFILCASKNGTFTISPAHVVANGRKLASKAVKITVSGASQSGNGSPRMHDDSDNQPRLREAGTPIQGGDLFIKVSANKRRVHEQEPVLLTYKVYTLVDLTELEGKMPDLTGFHTQEIPLPQQKSYHIERVNGRAYRCVTWSQYVMYPQMTGKLEIPSITFTGTVIQQNRNVDPFEAFLNGGSGYIEVKKKIKAPGVTIQVDPLPKRPVIIVIRLLEMRKRKLKLKKFGDLSLLKQLMPDVSSSRKSLKFWLMIATLALLIVMLARPQMGTKISQEKRKGIEVIISLDISNSMRAEDVVPSRLDKSKMLVENMVDNFTNDKVGLVVFAGDAFIQLPITSDYVSAKMFLQNTDPSLIATQGTDLAGAIELSSKSFTQQDKVGRAILIITDGEDHEGGAIEAAEKARKNGIRVFVLGVGSTKGSPVPDGNGGYMKDNSGQEVISALNEEMCKQVAQAGGGAYIHVDNTSLAQRQLNDELTKLQKGDISSVVYSEYDEQFQAVGILVLILLIIEMLILERKNPFFKKIKLFK